MKLKPEQIKSHLAKTLMPIYMVSGDEQLLVQECCDQIRQAARQQGFTEREVIIPDSGFEWEYLLETSANLSLFGDKKIIELKLSQYKISENAKKVLIRYAESSNNDNLLLISNNKLDASAQKSKWVKALDQQGALIQVWPISAKQLPYWIKTRMQQAGLQTTPQSAQWLAEKVEGNLLAAAQEIEKLKLLSDSPKIDEQTIQNYVGNSARYDVFKLLDVCLLGQQAKAIKILNGLKSEGNEPTMILWALSREIRQALSLQSQINRGTPVAKAMQNLRIWDSRKPLFQNCLNRHNQRSLSQVLLQAADVDQTIKGLSPGSAWIGLSQLVINLSSPTDQHTHH